MRQVAALEARLNQIVRFAWDYLRKLGKADLHAIVDFAHDATARFLNSQQAKAVEAYISTSHSRQETNYELTLLSSIILERENMEKVSSELDDLTRDYDQHQQ